MPAGKARFAVAVTLGALAVSAVAVGPPAHADGFFDAVAAAQGVYTSNTPGYQALGDTFDGGGFDAQAEISALGVSTAYSSPAYPGGVVNGEAAGKYPAYVSSNYPDSPKATGNVPGTTLTATSSATESSSLASNAQTTPAGTSPSITSTSDVKVGADDTITVTADTVVSGISVAGVLTISGVHAHAVYTRTVNGTVTHDTSLDITGAMVGTTPVTIGSNGVTAAGSTTALPVSASVLDSALAAQGVTVTESAAVNDANQSLAPALQIVTSKTVPEVGPVSSTQNIGFARASVTGSGTPGTADTPGPTTSNSQSFTTTPSATPTKPAGSTKPVATQAASAPSQPVAEATTAAAETSAAAVPAGGSTPDAGTPTQASAPVGGDSAPQQQATAARAAAYRTRLPYSWISLYVIAVCAALLAVGGGLLIRHLGVRAF